jgi:hypothetical protein
MSTDLPVLDELNDVNGENSVDGGITSDSCSRRGKNTTDRVTPEAAEAIDEQHAQKSGLREMNHDCNVEQSDLLLNLGTKVQLAQKQQDGVDHTGMQENWDEESKPLVGIIG